jgi:hypothetical protein
MPQIPGPRGFTLRDALIGAAVAAALIELAPGIEPGRAHPSEGIVQPGVKPAHVHPPAKPKSCHDA